MKWQPTPVFLPGKSHGQGSLVSYSPRGRKELDTTERLHFHPLQYSALENSMDCTAHGVAKSQTPLSNFHFQFASTTGSVFSLCLLIHGNRFDSHPVLLDKQVFSLKHSTDGILLHLSLPKMIHIKFIIFFVS